MADQKSAAKTSQKSQSEADSTDPVGDVVPLSDEDREQQEEDAAKHREAVAKGKEKEPLAEYDPFLDPVVPSSAVAQTIRTELEGLGESPTLQALHDGEKNVADNKKAAEKIAAKAE